MSKIRIVCYGDSNTWGYNPHTATRYPEEVRWTGLLQEMLGNDYKVIEEGQNGRTIATDDPCEGERNGIKVIVPCIESQKPFDLLILMLGTNDLKGKFRYTASDIAGEMQQMLEKIEMYVKYHMYTTPKILLVSPVHVGENIRKSCLGEEFEYERSVKVSRKFAGFYEMLAKRYGCDFLDAANYAQAGMTDAIHLEEDGHKALAEAFTSYVRSVFEV